MAKKTLPYWWITRPKRKPDRIPQSLRIFAAQTVGRRWVGNLALQMAFEDSLDGASFKRSGDYTERARGNGGSGGRTHAALLYSLGLWFSHKDSPDADEEIHLTLAGQALVDQENAFPVLRRQILAHQFPSAFSVARNVDRKFQLRPFVALLKLLKHDRLDGYLTDAEIAACVIGYTTRHNDAEIEKTVRRILDFRSRGVASLPVDFTTALKSPKSKKSWSAESLIAGGGTLGDIANTFVQWLRYIGYGVPVPGEVFNVETRTVTALNPSMEDEIDQAIQEWGSKPLEKMFETDDQFSLSESSKAFQRGYGKKPDGVKDQRTIKQIKSHSEFEANLATVSASLNYLYATKLVTEPTDEVVDAVRNHCGLDPKVVRDALKVLISSPTHGVSAFLDRYEEMSRSGAEKAIDFEKATAEILRETFGLGSRQLGQTGAVPDVEVWSEDWGGIIDTKAYLSYGLPLPHQRAMYADYVPAYAQGVQGRPLRTFMYISNGFANSFEANLRKTVARSRAHVADIQACGISMIPWRQLIIAYQQGKLTHDDLLKLWTLGREVTSQDVKDRVEA